METPRITLECTAYPYGYILKHDRGEPTNRRNLGLVLDAETSGDEIRIKAYTGAFRYHYDIYPQVHGEEGRRRTFTLPDSGFFMSSTSEEYPESDDGFLTFETREPVSGQRLGLDSGQWRTACFYVALGLAHLTREYVLNRGYPDEANPLKTNLVVSGDIVRHQVDRIQGGFLYVTSPHLDPY